MDLVYDFVEEVPGGPLAVLGAAAVGLLGVVFLLCCALSRGSEKRGRPVSVSESEGEEDRPRQQQSKSKLKQQSSGNKKVTLPPHPLLAAEFKGHTGAVLSLDYDTSGKYLVSCSDGELDPRSRHLINPWCSQLVGGRDELESMQPIARQPAH